MNQLSIRTSDIPNKDNAAQQGAPPHAQKRRAGELGRYAFYT